MQFVRLRVGLLCLVASMGCGDDGDDGDDGRDGVDESDASVPFDAAEPADAMVDAPDSAPPEGCARTSVTSWALQGYDDVSIAYEARVEPSIGGEPLVLLFERRGSDAEVGTFGLGPGSDNENFGDCSQCLYVSIDPMRVFYADRGSMDIRRDPHDHYLDLDVTNLRLIESEVDGVTRESTPVEGGACLEVDDFSITTRLPPFEWVCDADLWLDGAGCHCECGTYDPDCGRDCPPFDPGCTPIEPQPLANCEAGDVCAIDPTTLADRCTGTCNWATREGCDDPEICLLGDPTEPGTCLFADDPRLDGAGLGGECDTDPTFQKFCAIDGGFVDGVCDQRNRCVPLCLTDDDCTDPKQACKRFADADGPGYCQDSCESDADCSLPGEACFMVTGLEPPFFCEPADG